MLHVSGKSGVGKSSTVNSLLGERAAPVSAFKLQPDTETSTIITRQVGPCRKGCLAAHQALQGMSQGAMGRQRIFPLHGHCGAQVLVDVCFSWH